MLRATQVNNWHMEVQETKTWIREKAKLIESTDELGSDLAGVITLQRRLSGLERDLEAIQAKKDALNEEADRLESQKPEEAEAIREKVGEMTVLWTELKQMVSDSSSCYWWACVVIEKCLVCSSVSV